MQASVAKKTTKYRGEIQDYEKEKVKFTLYTRGRYVEKVLPCMHINSI